MAWDYEEVSGIFAVAFLYGLLLLLMTCGDFIWIRLGFIRGMWYTNYTTYVRGEVFSTCCTNNKSYLFKLVIAPHLRETQKFIIV